MGRVRTYLKAHRKAIIGWAGAILTLAATLAPAAKWAPLAVAAATALGVHAIPNSGSKQPDPAAKQAK